MEKLLRMDEAAKLLQTSPARVRQAVEAGELAAVQLGERRIYRFSTRSAQGLREPAHLAWKGGRQQSQCFRVTHIGHFVS